VRFAVKSSNLFPMPGNAHMLHLATISYGLREFVVFACIKGTHKGKCYIEEAVLTTLDYKDDVTASLKYVQDDNLAFDLAKFCEQEKLTDVPTRVNELLDQGKGKWLSG